MAAQFFDDDRQRVGPDAGDIGFTLGHRAGEPLGRRRELSIDNINNGPIARASIRYQPVPGNITAFSPCRQKPDALAVVNTRW